MIVSFLNSYRRVDQRCRGWEDALPSNTRCQKGICTEMGWKPSKAKKMTSRECKEACALSSIVWMLQRGQDP